MLSTLILTFVLVHSVLWLIGVRLQRLPPTSLYLARARAPSLFREIKEHYFHPARQKPAPADLRLLV